MHSRTNQDDITTDDRKSFNAELTELFKVESAKEASLNIIKQAMPVVMQAKKSRAPYLFFQDQRDLANSQRKTALAAASVTAFSITSLLCLYLGQNSLACLAAALALFSAYQYYVHANHRYGAQLGVDDAFDLSILDKEIHELIAPSYRFELR